MKSLAQSPWWIFVIVAVQVTVCTALAWSGSRTVPVVMLAVTSLLVALAAVGALSGWRRSLAGWEHSNEGWGAAQKWGLMLEEILRDALDELDEFDTEAAIIHDGRARHANLAYLNVLPQKGEQ